MLLFKAFFNFSCTEPFFGIFYCINHRLFHRNRNSVVINYMNFSIIFLGKILALSQEALSPLDIGIYTISSYPFDKISFHISITSPGDGCEVETSAPSANLL